jgi:subtilisin family serine protease
MNNNVPKRNQPMFKHTGVGTTQEVTRRRYQPAAIFVATVAAVLATFSVNGGAQTTSGVSEAIRLEISQERLREIDAESRAQLATQKKRTSALPGIALKTQSMMDSKFVQADKDQRMSVKVTFADGAARDTAMAKMAPGRLEGKFSFENALRLRLNTAELAALSAAGGVVATSVTAPGLEGNGRGSRLTAGDALLRTAGARQRFGVDGRNISVCVISDGVDTRAAAQATGDLPSQIEVCPQSPGSGDEGTAMLEIVHDLAPAAKLAFCSPKNTDLFDAIVWSAVGANGGKGCDVIVDDIFNLTFPRFQVGREESVINRIVTELGKTYVTIAGNLANGNYRRYFVDADPSGRTADAGFHDFGRAAGGASSIGLPVVVQAGGESVVTLQWSEPFTRARIDLRATAVRQGGAPIDAADSPFELQFDRDFPQNGDGEPQELLAVRNKTNEDQVFFILVKKQTPGFEPIEISLVNNSQLGSFFLSSIRTPDFGIIGHNGAEKAITVAAVNPDDGTLSTIRPYSSRGPMLTRFDVNGNTRFAFTFKPDVTATDGVAVTGAGGFANPFFGTSAAAPHVAGIAALLLNQTPQTDTKRSLQFSAADRGPPGVDYSWGYGVVDATRAIEYSRYFRSAKTKATSRSDAFADSIAQEANREVQQALKRRSATDLSATP